VSADREPRSSSRLSESSRQPESPSQRRSSQPESPKESSRLPARFERASEVGRGSFGEVWRAFDRALGQEVAIKRLRHVEPRTLRSLKRELEALADRRHTNLVAVHELYGDETGLWLVMEWIPGAPLDAWAGADPERWRHALPQLVSGLEALHELGFVHRDLGGENVRVTPEGRVVILDLGLASPRGFSDASLGHLHAVAPEQLARAPIEPAVDWYALGAMMFRGLAGRPPFEGRGAQVLAKKRAHDPPSLAELAPNAPPDLVALADALLARDPAVRMQTATPLLRGFGAHASPEPPFAGRSPELAALDAALAGVEARGTRHVRLLGPSGIGKSALLRRFVERHAAFFGRALETHAYAFAGLDAIVEQLVDACLDVDLTEAERDALDRVRGLERGLAADPQRAFELASDALRRLLLHAQGEGASVIAIDDVQWLDRDASRLLDAALRDPSAADPADPARPRVRVLLLTSARPGDDTSAIDRWATPSVIDVGPLDLDALETLAGSRVEAERLAHATGGVPLFAVTMARGAVGASLEEALAARVARLPVAEARLASLLSIAGRPLSRALLLDAAARLDVPNGTTTLRGLLAERLARSRTDDQVRVELLHGALARAARPDDALAPSLHAALDDAMEALAVDEPESHARHALGAGRTARAGELFERAAHRAHDALAFEHAAALAEEALACVSERARVLHELRGRALAAAGRSAEAALAYENALDGRPVDPSVPETVDLARRRAEQWLHAGRMAEGYVALDELLRAVGLALPSPRLGVARLVGHQLRMRWRLPRHRGEDPRLDHLRLDVCHSVGVALTNVDSFRGASFVLRAVWMAERADVERFARSLAFVAAYSCNGGRRTAALATRLIEGAAAVAHDPFASAMVEAARCLLAFHAGRYDESLARATEIEARFSAIAGAVRERVTARIYRCASLAMLGEWEALEEARAQLRRDGEARGDRFALVNVGSGPLNVGSLARGEPSRARDEAEESFAQWTDVAITVQHAFDLLAQARIDLYEGDAERAIARLDERVPSIRRAFLFRMPFVAAHMAELRARAELMRPAPDERLLRRAIVALRRERATWIDPMADVIEAGLRRRRGETESADELFARAISRYAAHGMAGHVEAVEVAAGAERTTRRAADPEAFARALALPRT
jgi:tetratricopeptide (TPR) repeat protein